MASKVHKIRFYSPPPQAINCISFNKNLKLAAIARADGSIEVWDVNKSPCLVRFIPGGENGPAEALGWVGHRLLSTGLNGALTEWDMVKLTPRRTVMLTGYAAWCLDVNIDATLVAVGTEQGYVNLYSVENDDIVYNKLFDKQDGRIVCCKFDKLGKILATGSIDTIRIWNVDTGHAITRMSVTRRQKEVIVWSVHILSDNTVVSGDSQGRLTFWDGTLGEQIDSYTIHKADILTIAVSDDEKELYCSGIDPIISNFKKVESNKPEDDKTGQWVKHVQRHIHEHDVRGLVVNDRHLISVGVDGYLTFSRYPPKWVMRVPPMVPAPRSFVCAKRKLVMLRYSNHLEVWRLGRYAKTYSENIIVPNVNTNNFNKNMKQQIEQDSTDREVDKLRSEHKISLNVTENPVQLIAIQSKKKRQIQCCALSPNGEFVVYATDSDLRMLRLETDDSEQLALCKVLITGLSGTCDRVAFSEDSHTMVAHCAGALYIFHVDPEAGATVIQTIEGEKLLKTKALLHLVMSKKTTSGNTYLIAADSDGVIEVFVDKKKKYAPYITLPKYKCVPTALTVNSVKECLIVIYADQSIIEYDLQNKKVTDWPGAAVPHAWLTRIAAVESVTVHPTRDALVCQDQTSLFVLERKSPFENMGPAAKRHPHRVPQLKYNIIHIKYLAGFHWLEGDEAVMVEVLPENIVSQLPPPAQLNRWHL